jgi:ceramide glucosyltransferase
MTDSAIAAASFCGITLFLHLISILIAAWRCRPRPVELPPGISPAVSIVRPVCGIDNFLEETLRTSFDSSSAWPLRAILRLGS